MNTIFERYEHLRNLCQQCHEEEYKEYLLDYPTNPFMDDSRYPRDIRKMILSSIADVIAFGSCDDMLEVLYYLPKARKDIYGDYLGND